MLGAVNLAHLHMQNGDTESAQELLQKAQAYTELRSKSLWYGGGIQYVRAQIAAVEGNNDARYLQVLDDLEGKLLKMREHPQVLASNEPKHLCRRLCSVSRRPSLVFIEDVRSRYRN